MMEFNLSDKFIEKLSKDVFESFEFFDSLTETQTKQLEKIMGVMKRNREHEFKEFIRIIKDEIVENDIYTVDEIFRIINKRAGDKLEGDKG